MTKIDEQEEEEVLLRRVRGGDEGAFVTPCESHRRRIWRVVASVAAVVSR